MPFLNHPVHKTIEIVNYTVLQIRVFRMAGDFSSKCGKDDHEQGVRPTMRVEGQNLNFQIFKFSDNF